VLISEFMYTGPISSYGLVLTFFYYLVKDYLLFCPSVSVLNLFITGIDTIFVVFQHNFIFSQY
jgi:hypothetical protein